MQRFEKQLTTLQQDVYKRLTTPFAFDGLVRLRCPPELRVAAAHGHVVPDPRHENLLLCGGCTPYDCMVLDLEYVKPSVGFSRRKEAQGMPVLQLVFQYSVLVPHGDVETDNDKSAPLDEDSVAAMLGGRCVLSSLERAQYGVAHCPVLSSTSYKCVCMTVCVGSICARMAATLMCSMHAVYHPPVSTTIHRNPLVSQSLSFTIP